MKKHVVIGITSGIAAYKSVQLIKLLKKEGCSVTAIMTNSATKMLPVVEVEKVTGNKVFIDLFEKKIDYKNILKIREVDHIKIADSADVMVIIPATANILSKIAYGFADDFLTTTVLAMTAPILICPSMNVNMWNNPAVQNNIEILKQRGYQIVEPVEGMLACGYEGKGRLQDLEIIRDEILQHINSTQLLKGKKIVVTAGGTIEKIDDVRYVANRSSGKMGIAIAKECFLQGADVLLLRAKNTVKPDYVIKEKLFSTEEDLALLIKDAVSDYDIIFHTAAVSDFRIQKQEGKLSSKILHTIQLLPRKKILDNIKKSNPKIIVIAFKAEYEPDERKLIQLATKRMKESTTDAIVANDISRKDRGFESEKNEVYVISPNGNVKKISLASKKHVAKNIIDYLLPILKG